jgi:predicted nucleic acid-binding Zn finger protein
MLPTEIARAQVERTERARAALRDGAFCIVHKSPQAWLVQNGDKEPYDVSYNVSGWTCTCPDYQRFRGDVNCKHIEAIRLTVAEHSNTQKEVKAKMDDVNNNILNGWTKLYHPSGVQVTLPIPLVGMITREQAKAASQSVDAYLASGWMPDLAGLEQGETLELITHIVRRQKKDDEGGVTPLVDLYANGNFRLLSVYLNNVEDLEAFKSVFGFPVADLPLCASKVPLKRGEDIDEDKQYVRVVSGVAVVWTLNPKWEGNDDKKHQKRSFVRWERKANGQPRNEAQMMKELGCENGSKSAVSSAPIKQYGDGASLGGNPDPQAVTAEVVAFERFVATNNGKAPASKEALRAWLKANPQ